MKLCYSLLACHAALLLAPAARVLATATADQSPRLSPGSCVKGVAANAVTNLAKQYGPSVVLGAIFAIGLNRGRRGDDKGEDQKKGGGGRGATPGRPDLPRVDDVSGRWWRG